MFSLCSRHSVGSKVDVQSCDPRSRRAGLAVAVHRNDRCLDPGAGQSLIAQRFNRHARHSRPPSASLSSGIHVLRPSLRRDVGGRGNTPPGHDESGLRKAGIGRACGGMAMDRAGPQPTLSAAKNHPSLADMADLDFAHLHVHSSYSLLEGALTIARLAELAKADHQPALGLTDTDNMFGALEFSEKLSGYGIQPIVGCALSDDSADT